MSSIKKMLDNARASLPLFLLLYSANTYAGGLQQHREGIEEAGQTLDTLVIGSKIGPGKKQTAKVIDMPMNYRMKIAAPEGSEEASGFSVLGAVYCADDKKTCLRPEPNAIVPLKISYNQWYTVESNAQQRRSVYTLNLYDERRGISYENESFVLDRAGFYIFPDDAPERRHYIKIGSPKHNAVVAYFGGLATGLATWFLYKGDVIERTNSPSECKE